MSQQLPLLAGSLPSGWCPTAGVTFWQEVYNKFFALGAALLPGGTGLALKVDDGPRTAEDQGTVVWLKTVAGLPERLYVYYGGYWVARHPVDSLSDFRMIVAAGSESDVWAMDGGDGSDPAVSVPTDATGAMWEVDAEFAAKSPMGVGTLSAYDDSGTLTTPALAIEGNAGNFTAEITIVDGMLPEHKHYIGIESGSGGYLNPTDTDKSFGHLRVGGGEEVSFIDLTTRPTRVGETSLVGESLGDRTTLKLNNTHPVRGVYFVKRTQRVFYVG